MPRTGLFQTSRARTVAAIFFLLAVAPKISAQESRLTMLDFSTGSEMEDYLRVMQIAGKVPLYPWSIRGFSRREITRLAAADSMGPWKLRRRFRPRAAAVGPLRIGAIFNSAFPYGANDGPVWAGRGLTGVISGGFSAGAAALSIAIDPLAFRATNSAFDLLPNGLTGSQVYNHGGEFASYVDYPQRFGNDPYSRVDPGNSSIRLDTRFVTAGVSTANEWMGPATEYPFLLSNNAPGFPHLLLGTGEPLNVWVGRLHVRLMWGRLDQSAYSPVTGPTRFVYDTAAGRVVSGGTIRLAASGEFVFIPRGVPGLELGVGRFFHVPNAAGEPNGAFWRKPFRVLFLKNEQAQGDVGGFDNQLASVFFRWVFPHSGLEIFGERGFEDQLYDTRDLILDLDHEREYMLGFQKTLTSSAEGISVLRAEVVNYQMPGLARDRVEGGIYVHSTLRQGHTNRGQLLGASPGAGWAAASTFAWTSYTRSNRTTFSFRRIVRDQRGDFQTTGVFDPRGNDVMLAGGLERMHFGRRADFGGALQLMRELNRNFSTDVSNLNLQLQTKLHAW